MFYSNEQYDDYDIFTREILQYKSNFDTFNTYGRCTVEVHNTSKPDVQKITSGLNEVLF